MKKIVLLFVTVVFLASCEEKEPTCIECFNGADLVFSGCVDEYLATDIDHLEESINQMIRPERCERY